VYAFDVSLCMPDVYALYVCLICMPYMYALYVCLLCMTCDTAAQHQRRPQCPPTPAWLSCPAASAALPAPWVSRVCCVCAGVHACVCVRARL